MNCKDMRCPPDLIDDFLNGKLSAEETLQLEKHLEVCDQCDQALTQGAADQSFWSDTKHYLCGSHDRINNQDTTTKSFPSANAAYHETPINHSEDEWGSLGFLDPTDDPDRMGRFAGYEISGIIGSGGMGIVMKGFDPSLDRYVAIKILGSSFAGQSASRKRFAREAQAAAAVLHDNVISIYGVDHWKGMPYLVMPYIKGESLQQRIDRQAPLPLEDILGISLQIARGLAAAHDQGLVHRDIKPANILMPASVSRVIITDFGLARTADDASLTRSGVLAGTPQYMSPEQARGIEIDHRADLFSLGSVIYAMACGRPPFRAETPYGILRKITDEPHRSLSQIRSDLPDWLVSIVDRLLEKSPDDRYPNANELASTLEDCLAHVRQPTTTLLPKIPSSKRSSRKTRWIVAGVFSVIAFFGVALLYRRSFPPQQNVPVETQPPDLISQQEPMPDSMMQTSTTTPSFLHWEYDDSQLVDLETELQNLLRDTQYPEALSPDVSSTPATNPE